VTPSGKPVEKISEYSPSKDREPVQAVITHKEVTIAPEVAFKEQKSEGYLESLDPFWKKPIYHKEFVEPHRVPKHEVVEDLHKIPHVERKKHKGFF
jgi:hypothetical protein